MTAWKHEILGIWRVGKLVRNASALIVSGGGSALLGVVFWSVAAHLAPVAAIGRTSAEIAAMVLLASLAQLSFGSVFERYLPISGKQTRKFIIKAYAMCISAALLFSIAYLILGLGHSFLPASILWRSVFVLSTILWTIFALQDSVLVGLRATNWVPVENISYSLLKLGFLPLFLMWSRSQGVLLAWVLPLIAVTAGVNWYLFGQRIHLHERSSTSSEELPSTRKLLSLSGAQYATLLVGVISSSIATLIVIGRLGPVANAHYFLPAQIAGGVGLISWSVVRSFLVEASAEPKELRRHARTSIKVVSLIFIPAVTIGIVFAPLVLRIFGGDYAANGSTLLRLLLIAQVPNSVTALYSTFAWIDGKVWWMAFMEVAGACIYFVVMLLLIGHFGILAIGIAALASSGVQAAYFLPRLIRRYRMTELPTSN